MKSLALAAAFAVTVPAVASAQAAAQGAPVGATPSKLVLDNSTRILTTLETRRAEFTKNRGVLRQFVSSEFNAMFDRDYAARLVLGVHGRGASEGDVKLFADALADNLMSRYGDSLLDFNTRLKVRVKSERALPNNRGVLVSSEFIRQAGEPIPVSYYMRQTAGGWKVFDVSVEGVSFVQTFRSQFDGPLKRKSIAQVAADLKAGRLQAGAETN
ncbi:ABC transporter substrate-binding protein [Lysobacter solisilvae]|uniref:ABC transporter substrate-binding protein n=2 Tax=Agrilutibacter solisilvae TaxID=2763317 RepID=A0A975ATI1_9GAMM|nr:ABC transporter substrate-binding protein [Lysobacter solisilvae]QSX79134.1 ABC transporter substrate-binding protein [Lysobacter solisilvae]